MTGGKSRGYSRGRTSRGSGIILAIVLRSATSPLHYRLASLGVSIVLGGCLARGEAVGQRLSERESDAGSPPIMFENGLEPSDDPFELPEMDPHSVLAVEPSHGPFTGGSPAVIRGAGFASDARVWFGATQVSAEDLVAIDPRRLQAIVPPGAPGLVEVTVQNADDGSTRRTLKSGYQYDAFYLDPQSAPVSGGTIVTLFGKGLDLGEGTEVLIDLKPCEVVEVRSGEDGVQELDCRVPEGTPGSKVVRVTTAGTSIDVLDGFAYADSVDGFRGGLGGASLSGRLRVIALDDASGQAIAGAAVIVGASTGPSATTRTDTNGVVEIPWEAQKATVTIAATCFQPVTFVDVAVDTVTAYLGPVLSPDCIPEGDPPATGGAVGSSGTVKGEIVFPGAVEFKRADWNGVPFESDMPGERVAYVFALTRRPSTFRLPAASEAITPSSDGVAGYEFELTGTIGNFTLYAVAGIENRSLDPPLFTAYSMGLLSGVRADPNETTDELYIRMDNSLDRALSIDVLGPRPGHRGPDRVSVSVTLRVGRLGYAALPNTRASSLLPTAGPLDVIGLPPLMGSLSDARFVVTATADTGIAGSPPRSVIGFYSPERADTHVALEGFVEVPVLEVPTPGSLWDGRELLVTAAPGGPDTHLLLIEVHGPADVFRWVIVAPSTASSISLPDPASIPELAMPHGPLTLEVNRAQIRSFDYSGLGYRHLGTSGWDAYAMDTVTVVYP
jgi:hypothetical protein